MDSELALCRVKKDNDVAKKNDGVGAELVVSDGMAFIVTWHFQVNKALSN